MRVSSNGVMTEEKWVT